MLTIYIYRKCGTCREALKWLEARGISCEVRAIRETPPAAGELRAAAGGDLRKIFNTSGMDYRTLGLKDRLREMSAEEALELLTKNGNLVKRPLLVGDGVALAGFKREAWEKALGSGRD